MKINCVSFNLINIGFYEIYMFLFDANNLRLIILCCFRYTEMRRNIGKNWLL